MLTTKEEVEKRMYNIMKNRSNLNSTEGKVEHIRREREWLQYVILYFSRTHYLLRKDRDLSLKNNLVRPDTLNTSLIHIWCSGMWSELAARILIILLDTIIFEAYTRKKEKIICYFQVFCTPLFLDVQTQHPLLILIYTCTQH